MKTDKILVKVIATIAVFWVVTLVIYFAFSKNAFDGSWGHTYFFGSILFFCVVGLIGYFVQKRQNSKKIINQNRSRDDYGKHPNDFERRCCFVDQIIHVGEGTKKGDGEEVMVKMQSGKTAIYLLFSERYNYIFENTGQRNWKYLFLKYVE